ncbi:hypothetical protein ACHHYP_08920 [Achlya hypogyna]|uniref:Exonuclease 1 n=1 Tax=Achlya hypogyna TaxID=1202772 RepID=A0A1V9ZKG0_ACHHY|nr:hypothetical protein ACHHYP_08920 [Achlya hypogyna]
MGVDGLLGAVKDAFQEAHVRDFLGQTVVVDALSWLHKACYGCAWDLAMGNATETYVLYVVRRAKLLRDIGITPILVFDGQKIPLKSGTHDKRQSAKEDNRQMAMRNLQEARGLQGQNRKDMMAKTMQGFQRSIKITSSILQSVHNALRDASIDFVIAPFEADAQMVYLCKTKKASAIITEDSDILVYCAAANVAAPVLFKLDDTGACKVLSKDILHTQGKHSGNAFLRKVSVFLAGDQEATRMFVQACILAGCDFLESLPRIGIVTAFQHIFGHRGAAGAVRVPRVLSKLKFEGVAVPSDYHDRFCKAEALFYHHYVFDPDAQRCVFLVGPSDAEVVGDIYSRVTESLATTPFLGALRSNDEMLDIYRGRRPARDKGDSSSQGSSEWSSQTMSQPSQPTPASQSPGRPQSGMAPSFQSPPPRTAGRRRFGADVSASPEEAQPAVASRPVFQRQKINCEEVRATSMENIFSVYAAPPNTKRRLDDAIAAASSDEDEKKAKRDRGPRRRCMLP